LPPVSTTLAKLVAKFAAVVVDISANFWKIQNDPNGILWGCGETDSWKKPETKISGHYPFNSQIVFHLYLYQVQPAAAYLNWQKYTFKMHNRNLTWENLPRNATGTGYCNK
jgi:hypothetical protein